MLKDSRVDNLFSDTLDKGNVIVIDVVAQSLKKVCTIITVLGWDPIDESDG